MATQMSAITLVGTTGQGYRDGLRFVQFYFGLPLAMIILSVTVGAVLLPRARLHRVRVSRAALRREDARAGELLFLLSARACRCGVIARGAGGRFCRSMLGWSLPLTVLAIGLPTSVYTMLGGVQAVAWTDVKQMVVIVVGVCGGGRHARHRASIERVGLGEALHVAGATGRLQAIDFSFDLSETYTFWSGLLGGAVPDAVVLRLRSEPGAALPDGEVGGRGAPVAADERLREDPAPAVDSAHRRAGVRVLPVQTPPMLFNPMHDRAVQADHGGGAPRRARHGIRPGVPAAARRRNGACIGTWRRRGLGHSAARARFLAADGRMRSRRKAPSTW